MAAVKTSKTRSGDRILFFPHGAGCDDENMPILKARLFMEGAKR
jgi:hypothetical protein